MKALFWIGKLVGAISLLILLLMGDAIAQPWKSLLWGLLLAVLVFNMIVVLKMKAKQDKEQRF